jgi:hypothetical protein
MIRLLLIIFLFAAVISGQQTQPRYALIIGQNDGGSTVNTLKFAERDAERMASLLRELGDFEKNNIIVNLHPDSADLIESFEKIEKKIRDNNDQEKALFLFYYSGHADAGNLLLEKTKLPLEPLQNRISKFPAAFRIAIFDACQSGVVTAFKGGKRVEPFFMQGTSSVTIKGQVVIASAAATERAQESSTLKGSIFTFHWINGLRGSADISSDSKITLNEAYQYAYRKTIETSALATGEIQHPVYRFNITGQGDIILTNLNKSGNGIVLGKNCEGKFLVLSEDFLEVYADFYKASGNEFFVSLNPGTYTVINAIGREVGTCEVLLKRKRNQVIEKSMFIPNTITESRIKGVDTNSIDKTNYTVGDVVWGIGSSVVLVSDRDESRKRNNFGISVMSNYNLIRNFWLFGTIYSYPFMNNIGGYAGSSLVHNNGFSDLAVSLGMGGDYFYNSHDAKKDVTPIIVCSPGFITRLSNHTSIGFNLPVTLALSSESNYKYRFGVSLSFFLK